jgi:hypothetical protein
MKRIAITITFLMVFLSATCPVRAYVYYVEAEDYDPENSVPSAGGGSWAIMEDDDVFGERYLQYSGPHAQANTSLLYPLPRVDDDSKQFVIWIRCIMPDTGADSYFLYVSTDGGNEWGPQQTVAAPVNPDWQWANWSPITPFEEGEGNVLRISEREDARADIICIRNDGGVPSEADYASWLEAWELKQKAVEPGHKLATTWGAAKSAY